MTDTITALEGWVTLPEAADQMGISRAGLWYRVNHGQIPSEHVRSLRQGGRSLILISHGYVTGQVSV